jgi:hypothetical protein
MSASAHTTALPPKLSAVDPAAVDEADHLAASVARVERRLRMLDDLAEMAMKLASRVTERALAEDLAKLSRAVRLTLDLAGRLEETLRRLRAGEITARAIRRQEGEATATRAQMAREIGARGKVAGQVATVIFSESESERECEDLLDALEERLSNDAAYIDAADMPLREVVERLCADLGLQPDWSGWTDDGWPEPADVFEARPPWSPFSQVGRKPLHLRA